MNRQPQRPRFFVLQEQVRAEEIRFSPEESFRIRNVLRLKRGAMVTVLNNRGMEWGTELVSLAKRGVTGVKREERLHPPGPRPRMILGVAAPSPARMDWMIQKATELGVDEVRPLTCRRAKRSAPGRTRMERWRKIAKEAAEQSRRVYLPEVREMTFLARLTRPGEGDFLKILFWEQEAGRTLHDLLKAEDPVRREGLCLAVGPEGGFDAEEVRTAKEMGFQSVSLGGGVLRVETAALAGLSVLQYLLGRLG